MKLGFNPYTAAHLTARVGQDNSSQDKAGASNTSTNQDKRKSQTASGENKVMSFKEARCSHEASTD